MALKHNFLLRGFFNRRGYYNLDEISPADYRSGVLENGKRKTMRIWLRSSLLFAPAWMGPKCCRRRVARESTPRCRPTSSTCRRIRWLSKGTTRPTARQKDRWDGVSLTLFLDRGELQLANGGTR